MGGILVGLVYDFCIDSSHFVWSRVLVFDLFDSSPSIDGKNLRLVRLAYRIDVFMCIWFQTLTYLVATNLEIPILVELTVTGASH